MIYTFGVLFESNNDKVPASPTVLELDSETQRPPVVEPNAGVVAAVLVEEATSNPEEVVEDGVIPKSDGGDNSWLGEVGGGTPRVCC